MRNLFKQVWAIAVVGIILASCSKSSDELTNAIPSDAFYVVHVNTESLIKKADWNVFENPKVSKNLALAKIALDSKGSELFDAFVKDPNALGLDLKGEAYMYISPSSGGMVLKVNDVKKLQETLVAFKIAEGAITEKDNSFVYKLDRRTAVAWNNKALLFVSTEMNRNLGGMVAPKADNDDLDIEVLALTQLNQEASASINSISTFAEFLNDRKDISVYSNYQIESMTNMLNNLGPDFPVEIAEELKSLKGLAGGSYVSFDKGAISVEGKAYYENSESEKKFKELTESMMDVTKGEQVKYLFGNPLFAATTSLKGDGVKAYLEKLGLWKIITKEMGENVLLVETVMNNIQGDVSFAVSTVITIQQEYEGWDGQMQSYNRQMPELAFFADCKDGKAVMDVLKGLIPTEDEAVSSKIKEVSENVFKVDLEGIPAYVGIKDNMFFFTNVQAVYDNIQSGTKKDNIISGLAKGNYVTIAGDLQILKEIVRYYVGDDLVGNEASEFINLFDTYEFTNKDGKTANGQVKMKDEGKNSLAQICHYVDNLITRQMP